MKVKSFHYFQALFLVVCIVGLAFQIKEVCYMYFEYKTTNRITIGLDNIANVPTIAVCVKYLDILDRKDADLLGIKKIIPRTSEDIKNDMSKLTVKQIFELTPKPEDTLESCVHRDKTSFRRHSYEGKECADLFLLKKFFMQEVVCYTYTFKTFDNYSITGTSHAIDNFFEVYHIILTDKLKDTEFFYLIVFDTHDDKSSPYPTFSRDFAPKIHHLVYYPHMNQTILKMSNTRLRYRYQMIHLLEAPYETNCTFQVGRTDCFRECMINIMRNHSRVPFSEIIDEPVNLKAVSYKDLEDKSFEDLFIRLENSCNDKCRMMPCFHTFCITIPISNLDERFVNKTKMSIYTPEVPVTIVYTSAQISLVEFVIYILSSFGIWFGVTVASISPNQVHTFLKKTFKTKEAMSTRINPQPRLTLSHHQNWKRRDSETHISRGLPIGIPVFH